MIFSDILYKTLWLSFNNHTILSLWIIEKTSGRYFWLGITRKNYAIKSCHSKLFIFEPLFSLHADLKSNKNVLLMTSTKVLWLCHYISTCYFYFLFFANIAKSFVCIHNKIVISQQNYFLWFNYCASLLYTNYFTLFCCYYLHRDLWWTQMTHHHFNHSLHSA